MLDDLAKLQAHAPLLTGALAFVYGTVVGSFLNLVVHRLPLMLEAGWRREALSLLAQDGQLPASAADAGPEAAPQAFNLLTPGSHCPGCKAQIKARHKVPILSYLMLKGRCAACGMNISPRYPLVEAAAGALTVMVVWTFGLTLPGLLACLLTWALLCLALIDQDTQLLPDQITLPLLWLGLLANLLGSFTSLEDALLGALAGYLSLWTLYQAFRLLTGKEGLGYGDFKLLAMLGAWLGWQALPQILIISSLAGTLIGGTLLLVRQARTPSQRALGTPLPFGPYLAAAGWIALIWGNDINQLYLALT